MRAYLCTVALVGFLAWTTSGQAPVEPVTVETVLARVRTALAVADFPANHSGWQATGKITHPGEEADFDLILDGQGRFRMSAKGLLADIRTFDGTHTWTTDWTGATHQMMLHDRDMALMTAWLCTGFWAVKPELFELAMLSDKCTEKEVVLSVRRKVGLFTANVTLDRATWLPSKATGAIRDHVHAFTFERYPESPGLKLPWRWTHSARGVTSTTRYDRVRRSGVQPADTFRLRTRGSTSATFDAGKNGALTVKKAASGHLLVKPTFAAQDAGWFVFDSGSGSMAVDKKLVQKLGLVRFGQVAVGGAVAGTVMSAFVKAPSIELGPVTLKQPICIELDLQFATQTMGEKINGIVGYPLFQAAVVEIDCAMPAVTLHDPARFQLPEGAAWQLLIIDNYHPLVEARYEGDRTGWFMLDTGMTDTVSFYAPTVRRHKLLIGRPTTMALHRGLGGVANAKVGTLEWFEIGGQRFEKPTVTFAEAGKGVFANAYAEGNLGQAFLTPFRVFFHFGAERIAFVQKPGR
jgi:hypothetical protein